MCCISLIFNFSSQALLYINKLIDIKLFIEKKTVTIDKKNRNLSI